MKKFTIRFVLLLVIFFSYAGMAQSPWVLQRAIGLPNSLNPLIQFSAVDENVCWGIQYEYNSPDYIRTTDGGLSWSVSDIQGAVGLQAASIAAIDASTAWVAIFDPSGTSGGGLFKTTNAGAEWTKDTTVFRGSGGHPDDIHFFDSNNGVAIGNPRDGNWEIYTTANAGTNWTKVPFSNIPPPASNEITGAGLFASAGNNIWFGTYAGGNSVYRSTDRGLTWSAVHNLFQDGFFCVAFKDSLNGLACSPFGAINQISRTTNGGVIWTAIPNVPSTPSPYFISYVQGTPGAYVITSHHNTGHPVLTVPGSAYSTDDGSSWIHIDNLPHQKAEFVSTRFGWSGGANDSIYKWDSNLPTSVTEIQKIAESYGLEQNYPNPFNPSTTIHFSVSSSEFVTLKIYDVLGNEVTTLVKEEKPVGTYEVNWSALNLSSGIYFYQLRAGSFIDTKKMILLR